MVTNLNEEAFLNDEEAQSAVNETIDAIAKAIQTDEQGVHLTNPKKLKDVMFVYKLLKYMTSGKKVRITYELNKPYVSMAYVSVVGMDLHFQNAGWFAACAQIASNVDIFPKTDGSVQIDFTFNGFANKLD